MIRFNRRSRRARLIPAAAMLLAVALLAGCSSDTPEAIGVNAVMADPAAYTGQIAIRGVVQNVDANASSIAVIDETEYATCGLTPCNSASLLPIVLPIGTAAVAGASVYEGALPALEDVVVVVGEIKSTDSGKYFDVERIERNGSVLVSKR
ncbi:MAG: hypothetical protein U1E26_08525 [Coriobacteriia bacterium]|nr:hypothetical protein [Coriobacteriia bacterium]